MPDSAEMRCRFEPKRGAGFVRNRVPDSAVFRCRLQPIYAFSFLCICGPKKIGSKQNQSRQKSRRAVFPHRAPKTFSLPHFMPSSCTTGRPLGMWSSAGKTGTSRAHTGEGAERLATFFTLMQSCKRVKLNPWVYLTHVFSVIEDYSSHRLDELTPSRVKAALQAHS